jgi:hypothetical protein
MEGKIMINKIFLTFLVIVTLALVILTLASPEPVQASGLSRRKPCDGFVCKDITSDPKVMTYILTEQGYAWSCSNWCYKPNGRGYCAGSQQCRAGCD